ncbi:hypothetical protein QQ008_11460 [Fulvivirgaceae bacterium BMA10]|uniref:Transglutaminase domain-containing protein n=1 Tax=Splendidivirga corallicola TaxID=3051826 RepID=A0ABT8KNG4_9BACT|nr:hypothetical protein [Fulvivirgaceae bacterium BMA10]
MFSFKKLNQIYVLLILFSCQNSPPKEVLRVLERAGARAELEECIVHYQKTGQEEKLRAAYFLIANMDNKYSYRQESIEKHAVLFDKLDSLYQAQEPPVTDAQAFWPEGNNPNDIEKYWDTIYNKRGELNLSSLPKVYDMDVITADYLIENIDYAFKVWKERSWARQLSFDEFCEFILPYRATNEPLQVWRKRLFEEYAWIADEGLMDVVLAAKRLNDSLKWFKNNYYTIRHFPDLKLDHLLKGKIGACSDMCNLTVYVFRSQGIPLSSCYLHRNTSWNVLPSGEGKAIGFLGTWSDPERNTSYFKDELVSQANKVGKIYMHTYRKIRYPFSDLPYQDIPDLFKSSNVRDITGICQLNTKNLEIQVSDSLGKYVFLCEWKDLKYDWDILDWTEVYNGKATFKDLGTDKVYLPVFYKNRFFRFAHDPVYLTKDGSIRILKADTFQKEKAIIYRKMGMGFNESRWAKHMVGARFEASNDPEFRAFTELHTIQKLPSKRERIVLSESGPFRYVRYRSDTLMGIAEMTFFDEQANRLIGNYFSSFDSEAHDQVKRAFDGDIHSNFTYHKGGGFFGMDLGKPTRLGSVEYLFQNSFNTVQKEDSYELFFWEKNKWVSLGKQKANDETLEYQVPKNALLLLKNLSRGKAIQVFFMQAGEQKWG